MYSNAHGKRRHLAALGEFEAPFLNGRRRSVNRKVRSSSPCPRAMCMCWSGWCLTKASRLTLVSVSA